MALTADQITAIAVAVIQAAGPTPSKQSFLDNPFADSIDPASKTGLALFYTATAAVPTEKGSAWKEKIAEIARPS
eukprot:2956008-Ditylum_brightwellii.AAC.1